MWRDEWAASDEARWYSVCVSYGISNDRIETWPELTALSEPQDFRQCACLYGIESRAFQLEGDEVQQVRGRMRLRY